MCEGARAAGWPGGRCGRTGDGSGWPGGGSPVAGATGPFQRGRMSEVEGLTKRCGEKVAVDPSPSRSDPAW
ncbi:hypothetical protein GCM10027075_41350 [Streptomyces heilongjiangensis]